MDVHDRQTEASPPLPEDVKADLFDFVDDFARDEAEGRVLPLGDYLARYPRAQAEVAAEYLRLTGKIDGGAEARPSATAPRGRVYGHRGPPTLLPTPPEGFHPKGPADRGSSVSFGFVRLRIPL